MNETRRKIKLRARELCMKDQAAFIILTLLYQVATDWVSTILGLIRQNPLSEISSAFVESSNSIYESALTNGGTAMDIQPAYLSAMAKAREIFSDQTAIILLFLYVILFLYSLIMSYGYYRCAMDQVREGTARRKDLFSMFYLAGKIIAMEMLLTGITMLGFVVCFFPGIYFFYRYYMASFYLIDHPEKSIFQAMSHSARMTRGHKMELMICDISFLGWVLAAMAVTNIFANLGTMMGAAAEQLLFLVSSTIMNGYIMPYRQLTFVLYYESFRTLQPETAANS